MSLSSFLQKQFIEVIQWNETEEGILACRYPIAEMEIRNGARLTVRESQMAAFVDEGKIADVFGPGLYTLNTRNLPLLTDLNNWDKDFESPFKSDVYFFSTRMQLDQRWGTATPITIREKEFGAVRLRAYGIYSYRIADPRAFFANVCGTREIYRVEDLEGQLRNTIVARLTEVVAPSEVAFLDMAAHQADLAQKVAAALRPSLTALGLALHSFVIEKPVASRRAAEGSGSADRHEPGRRPGALHAIRSRPIPGDGCRQYGRRGGRWRGPRRRCSHGADMMMPSAASPVPPAGAGAAARFCQECGREIPRAARFCPECGKPQASQGVARRHELPELRRPDAPPGRPGVPDLRLLPERVFPGEE